MRADLQAGDVLLFKPASLLDDAIELGELDGSNQFTQYIHAAIVLDPAGARGFQMIAKVSEYFDLNTVNFAKVDVFRPTVPIDVEKLLAHFAKVVGTPYPYAEDVKFLIADMFDREGLGGVGRLVDSFAAGNDPRLQVCSATACDGLDDASDSKMGWPKATTDMRPCDIPDGNMALVVTAPQG